MSASRQQALFEDDALPDGIAPWERAADADRLAAQVVLNRPLETAYYYLVPDELRELIAAGQRVRVPFGRGDARETGYCVGVGPPPETTRRLKSVLEILDREPLLSERMLELTRWMGQRWLCGWGQVLNTVVPAGVKKRAGTRIVQFFVASPQAAELLQNDETSLPAKQRAVLQLLCETAEPLRIDDITRAAGCGTSPVNALREKGLILAVRDRTAVFAPQTGEVVSQPDLTLNADQQRALDAVTARLRVGEQRTFLLHGVTGSGKTEVYIQAIREVVGYGRQAIVLVPEISLTPQTIRRFRMRFESVAVLHSHLSDAERHWYWQQIARGAVQVVVGARSAVFAPTPNLGLIVIDEEHETSFKQDQTPRYHAREVARRRAELESVPLILGTATPTLESWLKADRGEDELLSLPGRVEKLPMPPVVIVDVRNDPFISQGAAVGRALGLAIRNALDDKGQVILFLNLRGFSPTMWCKACGESVKCPDCDITLTWHKDRNAAVCHSCDFESPPMINCPQCGKPGIRYLGIGTQRLEAEVKKKFPKARVLRMDSDSMRKPGSHDTALESFRHGEVDILLGTQMIAKGLDFPNVTLVGVVNADTLLNQPDVRASERTFQLISQVAGRTGRSKRGGRVFVQTSSPAEAAIRKAAEHDYIGFVAGELEHRKLFGYPPYSHLTRVILRGPAEAVVRDYADTLAGKLREAAGRLVDPVRILGPAPAPVSRLKGLFRYHFQLAAVELSAIHELWRSVGAEYIANEDVDFVVDVDPVNMR